MNVEMLRKVQQFLLDEPRRFDMDNWITNSKSAELIEEPPCHTACCIAGAAFILDGKIPEGLCLFSPDRIEKRAQEALGLTYQQSSALFYRIGWPAEFSRAYNEALTPLSRAQVGVSRIDHFIKTDGAE